MLKSELEKLVQQIVSDAQALSAKHTNQGQAPVNYACIFTQSQNEFDIL